MKATVSIEGIPQEMLVLQHEITAFLLQYYQAQQERALRLTPSYGRLWAAMCDILQAGGKRLRPYLFLLAYESAGGKNRAEMVPIAAAWELLHAGLLVHDDIIDRDYVRHGQLNIGGVYRKAYAQLSSNENDSAHFADGAALLAGDLFLNAAQHIILQSGVGDAQKVAAARHINKALYEVIGGELLDMEGVMQPLETVDARSIALLKTAVYSMVGPLVAGADMAGAGSETRHVLDRFGAAVGLGYQLRDDLLGVFGDHKKTGKTVVGDLQEAKRTLLMQETFRSSSAKDRTQITTLMDEPPISASDVAWLKTQIEKSGAQVIIEKQIADCEQRALHALDDLQLNAVTRDKWLWVVRYALYRDH